MKSYHALNAATLFLLVMSVLGWVSGGSDAVASSGITSSFVCFIGALILKEIDKLKK